MNKGLVRNKKGFTLVEMLVVIAIIAILVSVLIPTVLGATKKARASTDASNLRSVLAALQISMLTDGNEFEEAVRLSESGECKSFDGAVCYAVKDHGLHVAVYFVTGTEGDDPSERSAYGTEYFSDIALNGSSSKDGLTLQDLIDEYGENVLPLKTDD